MGRGRGDSSARRAQGPRPGRRFRPLILSTFQPRDRRRLRCLCLFLRQSNCPRRRLLPHAIAPPAPCTLNVGVRYQRWYKYRCTLPSEGSTNQLLPTLVLVLSNRFPFYMYSMSSTPRLVLYVSRTDRNAFRFMSTYQRWYVPSWCLPTLVAAHLTLR